MPGYSTKWLTVDIDNRTFSHMVELRDQGLDAVFHALGDATRRRMLRSLAQGERTVGQLAEPFQACPVFQYPVFVVEKMSMFEILPTIHPIVNRKSKIVNCYGVAVGVGKM